MYWTHLQGETAAVIVVGDELLSGAVRETNSHFIASTLRSKGIAVKQVKIKPHFIAYTSREAITSRSLSSSSTCCRV